MGGMGFRSDLEEGETVGSSVGAKEGSLVGLEESALVRVNKGEIVGGKRRDKQR